MHIELPRTVVRLTGDDRVSFLQNFCTADIQQMQAGEIREAFILNTKGKLAGHVLVLCHEDKLELNTVPEQGPTLIEHLDRYLIREDVELAESKVFCMFCFDDKDDLESRFGVGTNLFKTEGAIQVANCELAGQGILLCSKDEQELNAFVQSKNDTLATLEQLDLHRVRAGTPWFTVDSNDGTLPQELQRDAKAISFTKGCYLGQETVARIDALGRVNKLFVRLKSQDELTVGQQLVFGEKEVGTISSVAKDEKEFFGLAIVRRVAAAAGTVLNDKTSTIIVE